LNPWLSPHRLQLDVSVTAGGSPTAPAFGGSTLLLKPYGLSRRFSDDVDFEATMAPVSRICGDRWRSAYRPLHIAALTAAGFDLMDEVTRLSAHTRVRI
jgi:hypothetical protein